MTSSPAEMAVPLVLVNLVAIVSLFGKDGRAECRQEALDVLNARSPHE